MKYLVCLLLLVVAPLLKADSVDCLSVAASPEDYFVAPGEQFSVRVDATNICSEGYYFQTYGQGDSSGPFLAYDDFIPFQGYLPPGSTLNVPFNIAWFSDDAPIGSEWISSATYDYFQLDCLDPFSGPCPLVGEGTASTNFTATVINPVPEPGTLVLMATGIGMIARRFARRQSRA